MKIIQTPKDNGFSIEIKRFYLPIIIEANCPKCKAVAIKDLDQDYLSYPMANEPIELYFYCEKCEHEWDEKALLRVTLEII